LRRRSRCPGSTADDDPRHPRLDDDPLGTIPGAGRRSPVAGGGAVIVAPSNHQAGEWFLATYLGERQLRIDQRLELEVNNDEAVRVDKAMALSTPVTDALAAAVRDALHDELSRRPVPTILAARDGYVPSPIPRGGGVVPLLHAAPPR